jgi:hypothetical protein
VASILVSLTLPPDLYDQIFPHGQPKGNQSARLRDLLRKGLAAEAGVPVVAEPIEPPPVPVVGVPKYAPPPDTSLDLFGSKS